MSKPVVILKREEVGIDLFSSHSALNFITALENQEISGYYGTYPSSEEIDQVRGQLSIIGDEGCKLLLAEKTFYLRFALSLLLFLGLFFFLSYLVPDPIPLVDELAVSTVGAVLFNLWYRRRGEGGEPMVQERIRTKGNIDRIEFKESPFLKEVELRIENFQSRDLLHIVDNWASEGFVFSSEDKQGLLSEVLLGIKRKVGNRNLALLRRMLKKGQVDPKVESLFDLPLALFYLAVSKGI